MVSLKYACLADCTGRARFLDCGFRGSPGGCNQKMENKLYGAYTRIHTISRSRLKIEKKTHFKGEIMRKIEVGVMVTYD